MYNLIPGELLREPNNIAVYLREEKTLSIAPIREVFILESGRITANNTAEFPLFNFQTALLLKSIWVNTVGNRENDQIIFQVIENNSSKYKLTIRERDMPRELPYLVVLPNQTLSITPENTIDGVSVFAEQVYVVYSTDVPE